MPLQFSHPFCLFSAPLSMDSGPVSSLASLASSSIASNPRVGSPPPDAAATPWVTLTWVWGLLLLPPLLLRALKVLGLLLLPGKRPPSVTPGEEGLLPISILFRDKDNASRFVTVVLEVTTVQRLLSSVLDISHCFH